MQDISLKLALETVSDDLFFTLVRLGTHADTQALAPDLSKLLAQVDATAAAHTGLLRGMTKANALAIGARADVEAFAGDLSVTALGVVKQDRKDPRMQLLFPDAASTVQAYDEQKLRKWLDGAATALPGMADKELKDRAATAKNLLKAWDTAEVAQAAAATANTQHDATVRVPLRTTVNAARRDLHADLSKLATKTKRSKRWVESFFRAGSKKPKTPPPAA
jgi:hypothetical protein